MRTLLLGLGLMTVMSLVATPRSDGAGLAAEPVTIKYTWEKGEPIVYRITQETVADMTGVPGQQEAKVTQSQTMRVRMEATEIEDDGTARVRSRVESVQFDMSSPTGDRISYDSEGPDDAEPEHAAARAMAAFVGESFTFEMSPTGDVRDVRGMDQILTKIGEEAGDPAMQEMFRGKFGNKAMEAMLEQAFKMLPNRPVDTGDSWQTTVEQAVPTLGTLRIENTMTLDRVEPTRGRQLARIPINVTTTLDRANIEGEPLPPGTTVTMEDAQGEGVMLFDLDRGQLHELRIVSRMPMRMRMEMGEEAMNISQDITATVRIERVEDADVTPRVLPDDGADEPRDPADPE